MKSRSPRGSAALLEGLEGGKARGEGTGGTCKRMPVRTPRTSAAGLAPGHPGESDHRRQRAGATGNDAGQDEHRVSRMVALSYRRITYERFRGLMIPEGEK